jgi:uncharacterized protein YgiB involved in biofilm formation
MKRSKGISLALVSTIPFALTACTDSNEEVRTVSSSKTFESIQECVDTKIPVDVCSNSYIMALNEHKKIAPTYVSQEDCDGDFVKDYCVVNEAGKWMPKLGGFQITESHDVKYRKNEKGDFAPVVEAPVQTASSGSTTTTTTGTGGGTTIINNNTGGGHGGGGSDFLTGMLVGHAFSGGGGGHTTNNYYSEPVYKTRDSRGDFKTSTINERVQAGSSFTASEQTKSGFDYKQKSLTGSLSGRSQPTNNAYNNSGYNSGYSSGSRAAESANVTRGGFGNQAVARSSWGGGGSSSFGG